MKKLLMLISFVLIICLFVGCGTVPSEAPPIEYVYTTQEITYYEENTKYSFRMDAEYTQGEFASYYFEPVIKYTERQKCIEATEQILDKLGTLAATPEIYIFAEDTYDSVYITENKIYMSQQDWESVDFVANILLTVFGRRSHYGLAYGYATQLCNQFMWVDGVDGGFVELETSESYDLGLLCFDTAFVSNENALAVARVANGFVDSYISEHGETAVQQLLSASDTSQGMERLSVALREYYTINSLDFSPSVVRYGYGGVSYDYIAESDLAAFYIETDWVDECQGLNPLVTENFLHSNYAEVKYFFEINLEQMSQYQTLFALDDYNNNLKIIFSNNNKLSQYSFYQKGSHTIYVMNIDSLMHEYIHALTQPDTTMESWETEGFARYFSYRYDHYGIAFLNHDYNNTPESAATQYVHEYLEAIDRPIDMAVDYSEVENIAVHSRSYTNPNSSYVAGSSFVQYLVNQYGVECVIQHIYGSGDALPKTYTELVQDWNTYIDETYQAYSKYGK